MNANIIKNISISIIVPVYNVEQYLNDCIKSLVNQTHENLEIILIDDGSTDKSPQICDNWASNDSRIKVLHIKNRGVSHARNVGLDYAHGDYVSFVDADDWIDLQMYESVLKELLNTGAEVAGVGYVKETSNSTTITLKKQAEEVYSRENILCEIISRKPHKILGWELWDKIFKKELVTDVRFEEDIFFAEDTLFFWQTMKKNTKFLYYPIYAYHYRMRENSAIHHRSNDRALTGRYAVSKIYQDSLKEKSKKLRQAVWEYYAISQIVIAKGLMQNSSTKYENEIKKIQKFIRNNFCKLLRISDASYRQKMGVCYFVLPYSILVRTRKIILDEG